jgi:hypothetical protein
VSSAVSERCVEASRDASAYTGDGGASLRG